MASFTITPLTVHTGVEVIGLDFTEPIDTDNRAVLRRAFAEHHVLVMRDQHFTPATGYCGTIAASCIRPTPTMK